MKKNKKEYDFISDNEVITNKREVIINDVKGIAEDNEKYFDNKNSGSLVPIRIKELRKKYNLRQADLAAVLQCSTREYWRYEQQGYNTNYIRLIQIASFYNVSLDYLFGIINEPKKLFENLETPASHFDIKNYPPENIEV